MAIKALKTSAAAEENVVTRFEREAKSLANLQHENIIHVYDFHHERGAMFIVMEYVQGIDLYDLLEKCGRLPYDVAAILAMQVARALDYVHYRGIVHRDIKPANIMIARTGGTKVMDFGIARDTSFGDLTEAGTGIGTPAYMSPEQVLGDKLDARSDIFSLGVVLYQMVTGKKPFVEDEKKSAMHKIRLEKHESARSVNPEIPRELNNIIDRCLEKQPRDRWRSAQHMVMALERFLAKHVEMNHHARLVLFLEITRCDYRARGRGVFESRRRSAPVPARCSNRICRRATWCARASSRTASTLGVLLLFLGLIHVAPLGATPQTPTGVDSAQHRSVPADRCEAVGARLARRQARSASRRSRSRSRRSTARTRCGSSTIGINRSKSRSRSSTNADRSPHSDHGRLREAGHAAARQEQAGGDAP